MEVGSWLLGWLLKLVPGRGKIWVFREVHYCKTIVSATYFPVCILPEFHYDPRTFLWTYSLECLIHCSPPTISLLAEHRNIPVLRGSSKRCLHQATPPATLLLLPAECKARMHYPQRGSLRDPPVGGLEILQAMSFPPSPKSGTQWCHV